MRYLFLAVLFLIVQSTASAGANDLSMVVVGQKDQVLAVIHKSLETEFSNSSIGGWSGRIGYRTQFKGFFTGVTDLGAALTPMANGDAMEATAYRIEFSYKTQRNDGMTHVRSLKEQIIKQGALIGGVAVVDNPETYRTLSEQQGVCFNKLDNEPELAMISKKVALIKGDSPTLMMLADESKATEQEKAAIISWGDKRDKCNNLMKIAISFYPMDRRNSIFTEFADSANQLLLGLYKGKLTYGEFNSQRKTLATDSARRFAETTNNIIQDESNAQERAAETAHQNQLEQSRLLVEQQKANAMQTQANKIEYHPISIPQSTNCTSRAVGDTIQTNCN